MLQLVVEYRESKRRQGATYSGAPSYCETKDISGTQLCARTKSTVTASNKFVLAGAANGDIASECPLDATLEGTLVTARY